MKDYRESAKGMVNASVMLAAARIKATQLGWGRRQVAAVVVKLQQRLVGDIEHGRPVPDVKARGRESDRGLSR